jgi:hypothetical protein
MLIRLTKETNPHYPPYYNHYHYYFYIFYIIECIGITFQIRRIFDERNTD